MPVASYTRVRRSCSDERALSFSISASACTVRADEIDREMRRLVFVARQSFHITNSSLKATGYIEHDRTRNAVDLTTTEKKHQTAGLLLSTTCDVCCFSAPVSRQIDAY